MITRVVLFLTFFTTSLAAVNSSRDSLHSPSDTLISNEEYEQLIVESEQQIREIRTNADILDDLFKPIEEQAKEAERRLARAQVFQRAEYILLALLAATVLILGYLFFVFIGLKRKGKRLAELEKNANAALGELLPDSVVERVIHSDEIEPSIWANTLVVFIRLQAKRPFSNVDERMKVLGRAFRIIDASLKAHGVQKIKTSGQLILGVYKINRVTPQQQLQRMMDALKQIHSEMTLIEGGILDVSAGLDYGDVINGLIGEEELSFDIWGAAVENASRLVYHAKPGQNLASAELMKIALIARVDYTSISLDLKEDGNQVEVFELL